MLESIAAFWAEYGAVLTDGVWDTLVMVVISTVRLSAERLYCMFFSLIEVLCQLRGSLFIERYQLNCGPCIMWSISRPP